MGGEAGTRRLRSREGSVSQQRRGVCHLIGTRSLARTGCRSRPSLFRGGPSERIGTRHDPVSQWQDRAISGRVGARLRCGTSPEQECRSCRPAPEGADQAHGPDPPGRTPDRPDAADQGAAFPRRRAAAAVIAFSFRKRRHDPDPCAPVFIHRSRGTMDGHPRTRRTSRQSVARDMRFRRKRHIVAQGRTDRNRTAARYENDQPPGPVGQRPKGRGPIRDTDTKSRGLRCRCRKRTHIASDTEPPGPRPIRVATDGPRHRMTIGP